MINVTKIQGHSPKFASGGQIVRHGMPKPRHLGDPPIDPSLSGFSGGESSSYTVSWSRASQNARHPGAVDDQNQEETANIWVGDDGKLMIRRGDMKRIAANCQQDDLEFQEVDLTEFSGVAGLAGFSLPLGMSVKKNCKKKKKAWK